MTDEVVEALRTTTAALAAAVSLLERGGLGAAPSRKMAKIMIADYQSALDRGRTTLRNLPGDRS